MIVVFVMHIHLPHQADNAIDSNSFNFLVTGKRAVLSEEFMKLLSLFLCNPVLPTDECNAHENILCYYPTDVPLDDQMNDAGFCVALIRLQEKFGVPAPWDDPIVSTAPPALPSSSSWRSSKETEESDEHRRRKVRSVTLSKRRFTIIPLETHIVLCIVTNRETLRPNVAAMTSSSPSSSAVARQSTQPPPSGADASRRGASVRESQSNQRPRKSLRNDATARTPSLSASPRSVDHGGVAASCPYWEIPNAIGHVSDDVDESVIEILARLGETSHRMFSMMFGSVQWNYTKLCILECGEQRGVFKRPSRREAEGESEASLSSAGLSRKEYEEERGEQRRGLERVLREGFINRLVSAIGAATSAEHSLEGSFTCPEGIEIFPVNAEVHLMIASLASQLASAHPGAIRDTFVASGMKTAHSTLSVKDTATLFYLMKYYNSAPPAAKPLLPNESQRSDGSKTKTRRQQLRRSLQLDVAREFQEDAEDATQTDSVSWYDPERNLRSEGRRSDFLRTMQALAEEDDEDDRIIQALSSSQVPSGASSLHVADRVEFGFPFVFLGDNDPVGVFTKDIGVLRFMFLVNEKYLRITELRAAFEQSMDLFLLGSPIPNNLIATIRKTTSRSNAAAPPSKTAEAPPSSPTPSLNSSKSSRTSMFGKESQTPTNARLQAQVMESHYLYYYRSSAISQVRSSILQRVPSVAGSLVCPILLSGPSSVKKDLAVEPSGEKRRSVFLRQLLSFAGGAHHEEDDNEQVQPRELSLEQRECVHLLDCVRSDVLRSVTSSRNSCSTMILVRKKVWASVLYFGSRDLSCVVMDKSSIEDAEAEIEVLSRLVFYYSFRPPGM